MNKSESIGNLATALAQFQGEIKNPSNNSDNPFFKSKYASLDTVLNTVRPILSKYGLSIIQAPSGDGEHIIVATTLLHSSGEWMEFPNLVLKADKATAQGAGSAITYARRYALSAILGISSEDDDDGNNAEPKKPNNPTTPTKLSKELITQLYKIAESKKIDSTMLEKSIKDEYKKNNANELTKQEYDHLVARLEKAKGE